MWRRGRQNLPTELRELTAGLYSLASTTMQVRLAWEVRDKTSVQGRWRRLRRCDLRKGTDRIGDSTSQSLHPSPAALASKSSPTLRSASEKDRLSSLCCVQRSTAKGFERRHRRTIEGRVEICCSHFRSLHAIGNRGALTWEGKHGFAFRCLHEVIIGDWRGDFAARSARRSHFESVVARVARSRVAQPFVCVFFSDTQESVILRYGRCVVSCFSDEPVYRR